jgi:predicted negative regulator of RcsB-dependent stress response
MLKNDNGIVEISKSLWSDQSTKNWKAFAAVLKTCIKSDAVMYYRIIDSNKAGKKDGSNTCAELLDTKERLIAKVPLLVVDKGKTADALVYLKGLSDIKEKEKERIMKQKLQALGYM